MRLGRRGRRAARVEVLDDLDQHLVDATALEPAAVSSDMAEPETKEAMQLCCYHDAMLARTMVYLEQAQLQALRDEAHSLGISLAELVRRIVSRHQRDAMASSPAPETAYLSIVALGASGRADVSEDHDRHLGEAIRREHDR